MASRALLTLALCATLPLAGCSAFRSYDSELTATSLVADFSLIDTRTFEVTSAFTAMGEAQDVKLVNGNDIRVTPNRGRVVREVSRALGEDVTRQLREQLLGVGEGYGGASAGNHLPPDEAPVILR